MSTLKSTPAVHRHILPVIIVSQFAGTSLWFAGNAIVGELQDEFLFGSRLLGMITSSVQLGFIAGTLCFAFFAISDNFSPRKLFLVSSFLGAVSNGMLLLISGKMGLLILVRFMTGFFLAGIYPVGMKIASGWYKRSLGKAIGYLVGALVLGTAFPHLLKSLGGMLPWRHVILGTSLVALSGGVLMYLLVPDVPFLKKGARFDPAAIGKIFRIRNFRLAALGYFGHMWELYAFWAYVPVLLVAFSAAGGVMINVSVWSFIVIAAGSAGCIFGGVLSQTVGSARIAFIQLICSGVCCLCIPLAFIFSAPVFLLFLIVWGVVVVGDSPQFSAIAAQTAPDNLVGTGLTIVNSIGFAITIVSIQLVSLLSTAISEKHLLVVLAVGPAFGIIALKKLIAAGYENNGIN
jgi:MFS family permease